MAATVDLVIRDGLVVGPDGAAQTSIAIQGETIVAVGAAESMPPSRVTIDARGHHVLPGAIDSHVHFREPGYTHKENWASGTAGAAMGGVTTVFEMPNTRPPTGTVAALKIKQKAAAAQAHVDYGIYGLLDENNIDVLVDLIAGGVAGFKCFMGNTFGDLPAPSDGAMLEGFEIIAKHGMRCVVHAENPSIMARRQGKMEAAGRTDVHAHLAARPEICEIEAVGRAIVFAEWTGARLHIAHKSSGDALYIVKAAKARGVDVTVETCPQYLLLDTNDVDRLGSVLRVNPPIRAPGHGDALWQALKDGTVDMISTDHAPHRPEEKTRPSIWDCDCGFPGVETQMPLMLTEINRGRASISDYVRWSAVNPAKAWGLYPRKGAIEIGSDADIVIVDMNRTGTIDQADLQSLSKISPWHRRPYRGRPITTLVRGRIVVQDGAFVGKQGWGKPVVQSMPRPSPRNLDKTTEAILKRQGAPVPVGQ